MPGRGNYWAHSFEASETLRDRQRSAAGRQHPCQRGDFCSGLAVTMDGAERVTSPALTYDVFCGKCRDSVYRALGEIPELWVRLHCEIGVKGQGGERVSMSRSAPIPLRADIDALLRECLDVLASWDERVRLAASLTLPDTQAARSRPDHGRQVCALARTLAAHLATLLQLPPDAMSRSFPLHDLSLIPEGCHGRTNRTGGYAEVTVDLSGADAGAEILALRHRARAKLGETRMTERLDVPCPDPSCDMLMLVRVQGSEYAAECKACGRLLSAPEYDQWVKLYAATLSFADLPQPAPAA
jgi:hypothetical protein